MATKFTMTEETMQRACDWAFVLRKNMAIATVKTEDGPVYALLRRSDVLEEGGVAEGTKPICVATEQETLIMLATLIELTNETTVLMDKFRDDEHDDSLPPLTTTQKFEA